MAEVEDKYPGCHQAPFSGLSNLLTARENWHLESSLYLLTLTIRKCRPAYANGYLFLFRFVERK